MFRVEEYHAETATPAEDLKRPPGLYKCPECRDTTIIWRTAVDKYKVKCTKCNADMVRIKLVPKPSPLTTPIATFDLAEQYGLKAWWAKKRDNADSRAITDKKEVREQQQRLMELIEQIDEKKTLKKAIKIGRLRKEAGELKAAGYAKRELNELAEIYASDPQRAQLEAAGAGVPICEVAFHYGKGTALTGLELGAKHGKEEAAGTRGAPGALKLWLLQKLHGGSYVIGRQKGLSGKHGGTRSDESIVDALPALLKGLVSGQAQA